MLFSVHESKAQVGYISGNSIRGSSLSSLVPDASHLAAMGTNKLPPRKISWLLFNGTAPLQRWSASPSSFSRLGTDTAREL